MEETPTGNPAAQLDEQARLLRDREARLNEELAALRQERERLHQITSRHLREVEAAQDELRQQYQALQTEREQLHHQKEQGQRHWEERWQTEWWRLQQKEQEVAAERLALDKTRREANTDVELQRRQLQAGWSDLRREQQHWQERLKTERSQLERQQQLLAERHQAVLAGEQALEQERVLQEATLLGQRQELGHLEMRIANWRQKLEALRGEAALLEAALCLTPPSMLAADPQDRPTTLPVAEVVEAPGGHRPLIEALCQIAAGLADEIQRVQEQQDGLMALRDTWQMEWQQALTGLAQRAGELRLQAEQLRPRVEALRAAEMDVQRRWAAYTRQQQELRVREARLDRCRRTLRLRRARLAFADQARRQILRRRLRLANQLREQWLQVRTQEGARLLHARTAGERARQEYLTARELLRRRLLELDERERQLLQRELVMTQVEQRILAQDPDPTAAQRVLDRLRDSWEKAVARQLRTTARREDELRRRAEQLESARSKLLDERRAVEVLRSNLITSQSELDSQRARLGARRQDLEAELLRLRTDRTQLLCRVRDQEQHLEQLSLLLLDHRDDAPPLALVA